MIDQYINRIINADCLDILRELPDKSIDLVLTDPPYGIGIDGQKRYTNNQHPKWNRKEHISRGWDKKIPPKEIFDEIQRVSQNMIIWGGIILTSIFNKVIKVGLYGIRGKTD